MRRQRTGRAVRTAASDGWRDSRAARRAPFRRGSIAAGGDRSCGVRRECDRPRAPSPEPLCERNVPKQKWGPALLPAPTAPSEGYAGVRLTLDPAPENRCVTPLLDPGSPAQASLPIEPLPLARSRATYSTARPEGSLVVRPFRPGFRNRGPCKAKTTRCSAALLGSVTLRVPLCSPHRSAPSRVALEKADSSGASYQLAQIRTRRLLSLPAGGDRTFGHLPLPVAVAGS